MYEGDILVFPVLSVRNLKPRNQVICPSSMAGEYIIAVTSVVWLQNMT